jgi:hypothetical protein
MKHRYVASIERVFVVNSCDAVRGRAEVNGVGWERINLRMEKSCMLCMRRMRKKDPAYRPCFPDTRNPVHLRLCPSCVEGKGEKEKTSVKTVEPSKRKAEPSKRPPGEWVDYGTLWAEHGVKRGELDTLVACGKVRVHEGTLYSLNDVIRHTDLAERAEKALGKIAGSV